MSTVIGLIESVSVRSDCIESVPKVKHIAFLCKFIKAPYVSTLMIHDPIKLNWKKHQPWSYHLSSVTFYGVKSKKSDYLSIFVKNVSIY